ncbi:MAG TPA: hypothetical protein PLY87_04220 [Planctomycetaceae bacterium]|nr:hypothetical protein [Planctomycetaceae bacterium]
MNENRDSRNQSKKCNEFTSCIGPLIVVMAFDLRDSCCLLSEVIPTGDSLVTDDFEQSVKAVIDVRRVNQPEEFSGVLWLRLEFSQSARTLRKLFRSVVRNALSKYFMKHWPKQDRCENLIDRTEAEWQGSQIQMQRAKSGVIPGFCLGLAIEGTVLDDLTEFERRGRVILTHDHLEKEKQSVTGPRTVDSLEIQSRQQRIETLAERIRELEFELLNEQRARVALEEIVHKAALSPGDLSARITNIVQGVRHAWPVDPDGEQQLLGVTKAEDAMTLINTLSLEVLTPLIRKEINDLLAEHGITVDFDAWLSELCDEEEVLISNVPLIDVISRLTTLGSKGTAAACVAASNRILEALGGKKVPKHVGMELVQAIRNFGAATNRQLQMEGFTVGVSVNTSQTRNLFACFAIRETGKTKLDQKTWGKSRFPNFSFS